jgi:AcrR family transcriptional regulator
MAREVKITRKKIIEAAIKLIEKSENDQSFSMRKIATMTKCAPPSIYYYFANKKAITTAVLQEILGDDTVIDISGLEDYLKDHPRSFHALFNDGRHNADIESIVDENGAQMYTLTPDILLDLDAMVGRLTRELSK